MKCRSYWHASSQWTHFSRVTYYRRTMVCPFFISESSHRWCDEKRFLGQFQNGEFFQNDAWSEFSDILGEVVTRDVTHNLKVWHNLISSSLDSIELEQFRHAEALHLHQHECYCISASFFKSRKSSNTFYLCQAWCAELRCSWYGSVKNSAGLQTGRIN